MFRSVISRMVKNNSQISFFCRDGSSQCGVYCTVANLLERLKNEKSADVFRTVKDLRDCRQGMVGNVGQYEFCYEAFCQSIRSSVVYENVKLE